MITRSYAHVGCATVLLGGAGLLLVAGGLEALQQRAPLGWLAIAGGLAIWAILGFLYWINARAYRRQGEAQRQPYAPPSPQRRGFWKGFFVTWAIVVAIHMAAFLGMGFADLMPRPEQFRAVFSLLALALVPAHVVAPVLGGVAYSLVRSTGSR
ncbi:ABC transporter permease [Stenotrophomonas maltophilia]|uniref:ABC transporter permease n=1 Tax=Stenotrophomonas maltophilia TaxID=40324 RepID=UPI000C1477E6|nr:ABC transporter permease [Stenotrophomonas maltophilia]